MRGMSAPTIYPTLRYRDARAAIDWLQRALGFDVVAVHDGDDGAVAHAELGFGTGMIMLGSAGTGDTRLDRGVGCASVYLVADDVDGLFERASAAGAEVMRELTDTPYGSREFTVSDPEGNRWSVGTYAPAR
jgi:uncharacterized glyoxalase superfamily protein PhnB